jgi:hypothetical protein
MVAQPKRRPFKYRVKNSFFIQIFLQSFGCVLCAFFSVKVGLRRTEVL